MDTVDRDYLERRHRESRERAEAASDPAVARIHQQFAEQYAKKLERAPRDTLHLAEQG